MNQPAWDEFVKAMQDLAPQGRVAIAVSGGPDSMALLHMACAWARSFDHPVDLVALTVDHGLRDESRIEAETVGRWAEEVKVPHYILTWHEEAPTGNIEAQARAARYKLLGEWCVDHGAESLLLAHHKDDAAETFLMRLLRGSGVKGLAGMNSERLLGVEHPGVRLLRPLLDLTKDDLKVFLQDAGQDWFEDPSNADHDLTRSRLRSLKEVFETEGLTSERMIATASRMNDALAVLESVADDLWLQAVEVSKFGMVAINLDQWGLALPDTRRRVLTRALQGVGGREYPPRYERLLRLEKALLEGSVNKGVTLHNCKVMAKNSRATIVREWGRTPPERRSMPGNGLWDGRFQIEWLGDERFEIAPLGESGLATLVEQLDGALLSEVSRDVLKTIPAAWDKEHLIYASLLNPENGPFIAHFTLMD